MQLAKLGPTVTLDELLQRELADLERQLTDVKQTLIKIQAASNIAPCSNFQSMDTHLNSMQSDASQLVNSINIYGSNIARNFDLWITKLTGSDPR